MADNVVTQSGTLASVPASTTFAADSISSVLFIRQKVSLGGDGTWTADAAGRDVGSGDGAMYVDPRAKVVRIQVTPTVSTSPQYTAKDAVGGVMTFSNAARVSGGSGVVEAVQIVDKGQQMASLELVLFDRTITASTDNSIFAPTDTECTYEVGSLPVNGWDDFSTNSTVDMNWGKQFVLNGTDLFGQLVQRPGTLATYVNTNDIVVTLTIRQD